MLVLVGGFSPNPSTPRQALLGTKASARFSLWGHFGFRVLGFRVLGLRILGFRILGFRV